MKGRESTPMHHLRRIRIAKGDGRDDGDHILRCLLDFAGWRIVGKTWLFPYKHLYMLICARGLIMSYGTFFRFYKEHLLLGASDSQVGILGSIPPFLVLSLSFIVGRLVDAQYHRWLLGVGGLLTPLAHFCLSFTGGQGRDGQGNFGLILLTQGLIAGIGMACFFMHSSYLAIQVSSVVFLPVAM